MDEWLQFLASTRQSLGYSTVEQGLLRRAGDNSATPGR